METATVANTDWNHDSNNNKNNGNKIPLDAQVAKKFLPYSLIRRAMDAASPIIIVRNPDSLLLAGFILVCLLFGMCSFPMITSACASLYGCYAWTCYVAWCADFNERFPREKENSPSHKDVPSLVSNERSMKRQHSQSWRKKRDEEMDKSKRILKVTHSFCRCTGKIETIIQIYV